MKLFKDSSLKEEITILDFGIVTGGEKKIFNFYVYNNSAATLTNLIFTINHKEISIIDKPTQLAPNKGTDLSVQWSPSITLKAGLKTQLLISGAELWS